MRSRKPEARSQNHRKASFCFIFWLLAAGFWLLPAPAFAHSGWFDGTCRRPITVTPDPEKPAGSEMCYVEFPTGGHVNPDGSDIRISTDEGKQVAAKVLGVGPGDRVSLIFAVAPGEKQYYANFGNAAPPANRPGMDDPRIENGLVLEMHTWTGLPVDNYDQVEAAWAKSGPLLGRTVIETGFYGINPFGPQEQTISKITGSLYAPSGGEYTFSAFADDRGSLYIDGTRVLFATLGAADVHIQGKIRLTHGRHDFLFYHVNTAGDGRFTVAWKKPDAAAFEVIPRAAFGIFARGTAGPLEEFRNKSLVADFTTQYAGECFYADAYSHRYKFAAREPKFANRATCEWDFGDGQVAAGLTAEHVYLTDNVYPVKLTIRVGANVDSITNRLVVQRDWPHIENPPGDEPGVQSDIVKKYDVARMPEPWLPRATWLHQRAGQIAPMLAVAQRLAEITKHTSPDQALAALQDAASAAVAKGQIDDAAKIWDAVPPTSDLEPRAARIFGDLLLWQIADFPKAVRMLQPYAGGNDPIIKRMYADALVLNQSADGRKILAALPVNEDPSHRAAKSGALARTIEYYIETKDWETGEEQWNNWQQQFPADFLEGYSIVLKTKLMELKGANQGAAAVAEAFAKAVPGSSYSPQLLFRAAKLLETTDPAKNQGLIKLLKDRYPEDPLSQ